MKRMKKDNVEWPLHGAVSPSPANRLQPSTGQQYPRSHQEQKEEGDHDPRSTGSGHLDDKSSLRGLGQQPVSIPQPRGTDQGTANSDE